MSVATAPPASATSTPRAPKSQRNLPQDEAIVWALGDASDVTNGPKPLTYTYFLAPATRRRGRLVTFDQGIALEAVKGATARNLLRI